MSDSSRIGSAISDFGAFIHFCHNVHLRGCAGKDRFDFAALVDELRHHNLVAADVVELAPMLDPTGVSSVLASKVVRSLLFLLDR